MPKTEIWVDYIETSFIFPTIRGGQLLDNQGITNTTVTYGNNIPLYLKLAGKHKRLGYGININYGNFSYTENTYDYVYNNQNTTLTVSKHIETKSTVVNMKLTVFIIDNPKFNLYFNMGLGLGYIKQTRQLYIFTDGTNYDKYDNTVLGMEMGLGATYYFHKNFGVYLETGISKSLIQFGIVLRTNTSN